MMNLAFKRVIVTPIIEYRNKTKLRSTHVLHTREIGTSDVKLKCLIFYCVPTEDFDADRERRRLISSARLTLASFVRTAKRRAYSAACSRLLTARFFFNAMRWRLRCKIGEIRLEACLNIVSSVHWGNITFQNPQIKDDLNLPPFLLPNTIRTCICNGRVVMLLYKFKKRTCSTTGVTKRWILGERKRCFLPSLTGKGRLMTYCLTSSSFDKLKSLRIFDARLGPNRLGTVTSVNPGSSCRNRLEYKPIAFMN